MVKTNAEIAREALAILDRDGWCKGVLTMEYPMLSSSYRSGSHCIGGAANLALFGSHLWYNRSIIVLTSEGPLSDDEIAVGHSFYEELLTVIKAMYPEYQFPGHCFLVTQMIAEWNNDEATTETDVRSVLEKIAAG